MQNHWSDSEARRFVERYAAQGVGEDLALRVYTSRLIGVEPRMVAHGGGNTSVKTRHADFLGEMRDVLCVKGSGWDLGDIEPEGLPAVLLDPLHAVRARDAMSDEDMVRFLRGNLLDPGAPNPSVETLLHAYLPQKFVDHCHSAAILALTNQPDGIEICRRLYGERVTIVPYVMPGFQLAKVTADAYDGRPHAEAIILHKHGLFTYGASARQSYERMIEVISTAEEFIGARGRKVFPAATLPPDVASVADLAPIVRGACAQRREDGGAARFVLEHRCSDAILDYVNGESLEEYGTRGVITPDHIIRCKNKPLVLDVPRAGRLDAFREDALQRVARYVADYDRYFEVNVDPDDPRRKLDPMPRLVLVPGVGLFGLGKSAREASVVADLAEITVETVTSAEAVGRYEALGEKDLFDMEYWSLEQAKLGKADEKPLQRHIALVTGGAGAIGLATAGLLRDCGAEVVIVDRDGERLARAAAELGTRAVAVEADVTDADAVRRAFDTAVAAFGGVDIVVSNAGAAWQGEIGTVDDALLRESFELNFFAHQSVASNAVRIMKAQGTGGVLLFNVSKQAVDPGRDFGPYGLPKAALLALCRQYALEYGSLGIRANAVNADRVRSGLLTEEMVDARARAREVTRDEYLAGNLLGREVRARDVARAFVDLALSDRTTAGVLTVDGGNMAAALR